MTVEEIAAHIGVDSLGYLSLKGCSSPFPTGRVASATPASRVTIRRRRLPIPDKLRFGCGC